MNIRLVLYTIILLLLHVVLMINVQFTLWPEMLVYPYLMNNGFLLYKDIINPYPPLFNYFLYFYSWIFGYSYIMFQLFTWTTILAIDILIVYLSWRSTKSIVATLVAFAFFVFFSIPSGINGLWYDLIVVPFCLVTALFFNHYVKEKKVLVSRSLFWGMFFFSIALFIKQQSVILMIPVLVVIFLKTKKHTLKEKFKHLAPLFIPMCFFGFLSVAAILQGTFNDYLYYSIIFPFKASSFPGYVLFPSRNQLIFLLCFLLLYGLIFKEKANRSIFLYSGVLLLIFSYPRFDYFHLIPSLAFLSLALSIAIKNIKINSKFVFLYLPIILIMSVFFVKHLIVFKWKEDRFFDKDIYLQAALIKIIVNDQRIMFMQNSPDQLLVLANLIPPKPWAIQFPWYLEGTNLQDRTVISLKNTSPEFTLLKEYSKGEKYDLGSYEPKIISNYIESNYEKYIKISDDLWLKKRINEKNLDINATQVEVSRTTSPLKINDFQLRLIKAVTVTLFIFLAFGIWYKEKYKHG